MSRYDWAESDYLADALDHEAHMREKAEGYLAELESGRENIVRTALTTATAMGTAGGMAFLAQTLFRSTDPKDGKQKPGMWQMGPIGLDLFTGLGAKAVALFANKLRIPASAVPYIDSVGQGALDHYSVMLGMRMGAAAASSSVPTAPKTSGVHGPTPVLGGGAADNRPVMGGGGSRGSIPEMGGGSSQVGAAHADPRHFMTEQQRRAWQQYAD